MTLPESDWRVLKAIHRAALERYCSRVLDECQAIIQDDVFARDRYTRIYRLLEERDRSIAAAFDDLRRSTALQRLAAMINLDVVTEAELSEFTPATRDSATCLAEIFRRRGKRDNAP